MEPLRVDDPARVASYRLLARLGEGGMGVVYLARSRFGRKVALKVLHESLSADDNYRKRFRREASAARAVAAVYTATVLDSDSESRNPWLATVYVPGVTLWQAVERFGPLPEATVRALALGMAEALRAIHKANVVHRDVKPGNVMLTDNGPRVIDFGIARPDDATSITRVGRLLGTNRYMSAEQAADAELGPPSDVYSLGVTLVYAATGEAPFNLGYPTETLNLSTMDWGLSEAIEACVNPLPQDRPSTGELMDSLSGVSLRGTDWLPFTLAAEVRRAGQEPPAPREVMGAPTVDGTAEAAVPPAASPSHGAPGWRRRSLLGATGTALWFAAAGDAPRPDVASSAPSARTRPGDHRQGVKVWKREFGSGRVFIRGNDGVLVTATQDGVHSLDPGNGEDVWKREGALKGHSGDRVYTLGLDPKMRQVDAATGDQTWSVDAGAVVSDVVADSARLYYAEDEQLYARDTKNGEMVWSRKAQLLNLAHSDSLLIGRSSEPGVIAFEASDGKRRWSYDEETWQLPAFAGALLIGCHQNGPLYALNLEDGSRVWQLELDLAYGEVTYHDGVVYVSSHDELHAVSVEGKPLWHREIGDSRTERYGMKNTIAISRQMYVCATDGVLHCIDPSSGHSLWTFDVSARFSAPPVPIDNRVHVGTHDGVTYALEAPR